MPLLFYSEQLKLETVPLLIKQFEFLRVTVISLRSKPTLPESVNIIFSVVCVKVADFATGVFSS